jgi:hypothetical protein
MFGQSTIEKLVEDSMFGIIKSKTGISHPFQIPQIEFTISFKKESGIIKINSIYLKNSKISIFERISSKEIKFSGASSTEFVTYLRTRGARQISDKEKILEKI